MNDPTTTKLIIETLKERGQMLGSQLGAVIKREKPWFQGLRRYITLYCADQVISVGRRGPDYIFAYAAQSSSPLTTDDLNQAGYSPSLVPSSVAFSETSKLSYTSDSVPPPANFLQHGSEAQAQAQDIGHSPLAFLKTPTFWSVFTNPGLHDQLALDSIANRMQIFPKEGPIPPSFQVIQKATKGEHNAIASGFLSRIEPFDRPSFQRIIEMPDPWPQWSWQIKKYADGKYFFAWLDFRTESLLRLFEERLAKLGLEPNRASPLSRLFMQSRNRRQYSSEFQAPLNSLRSSRSRMNRYGETSPTEARLRRLAMTAIGRMSIDELKRVWLPLGALVDDMVT